MSQYFYAICHDCKIIHEVSNYDVEHAKEQGDLWIREHGHTKHNVKVVSEYSNIYEDAIYSGQYIQIE